MLLWKETVLRGGEGGSFIHLAHPELSLSKFPRGSSQGYSSHPKPGNSSELLACTAATDIREKQALSESNHLIFLDISFRMRLICDTVAS